MPTLRGRCANDNHGRPVITVRFCPSCGVVLNDRIRMGRCEEASHAQMRRVGARHCVHCGVTIASAR
jgi:hypothetical protein